MCSVQSVFSEVNLSYKDSQREAFPHPTPIIVDKTYGLILIVHKSDLKRLTLQKYIVTYY